MITNVTLPTKKDLLELINEALENGEIEPTTFVSNHCSGLVKTLIETPLNYRAYGAYWWAIKRILNNQGYGEFVGSEDEPITADHFYIEDDVTTLCAAWYYMQIMTNGGNLTNNIHIYTDDVSDEQFEYSLEDNDFEKYRFITK
ncbi:hypothetical protein VXS06_14850 [Photobacterium toruni]|uniref:Antirestriction protein n=1 Tax=Photobacterium toruni TaxID=1935446 RepID=A0ABU6L913_9GAMM|nr:hypothetical protein [Photobacterium toruni]